MADEIRISLNASLTNGDLVRTFTANGLLFDQAAKGAIWICQNIGTGAAEAITTSEIGTLGWCFMRNTDTTNYVKYGPDVGGGTMEEFGKIEAGEIAAFRLYPGITLLAQADTAAVELDVMILED